MQEVWNPWKHTPLVLKCCFLTCDISVCSAVVFLWILILWTLWKWNEEGQGWLSAKEVVFWQLMSVLVWGLTKQSGLHFQLCLIQPEQIRMLMLSAEFLSSVRSVKLRVQESGRFEIELKAVEWVVIFWLLVKVQPDGVIWLFAFLLPAVRLLLHPWTSWQTHLVCFVM